MRPCSSQTCQSWPSTISGASIRVAVASITASASGSWRPTTQPMPCLRMPAFSPAISGRVSPRYCWWSMETGVMTVRRGRSTTLVASRRPPRPTSSRVKSAGVSLMARKAAAVVISKKVMGWPALAASQRSSAAARSGSGMSVPARRMRSWKRARWGEV